MDQIYDCSVSILLFSGTLHSNTTILSQITTKTKAPIGRQSPIIHERESHEMLLLQQNTTETNSQTSIEQKNQKSHI